MTRRITCLGTLVGLMATLLALTQPSGADATSQAEPIEVSTSITVNRPIAPKGRGRDFTLTATQAIPDVVVVRESVGLPSEVVYTGPVPGIFSASIPANSTFRLLPGEDDVRRWTGADVSVGYRLEIPVIAPRPLRLAHMTDLTYRYGSEPEFWARARWPVEPICLRFRLMRLDEHGTIARTRTSACRFAPPTGRIVRWKAPPRLPPGVRYRLRVVFDGNEQYLPARSRITYLRFAR